MKRLKSDQQEKRLAEKLNGRVQPGSGCGWRNKGDVKGPQWLAECKRTDKKQIILKKADIEKIIERAAKEGLEPLMEIQIQDVNVYILTETTFDFVRDAIERRLRE